VPGDPIRQSREGAQLHLVELAEEDDRHETVGAAIEAWPIGLLRDRIGRQSWILAAALP